MMTFLPESFVADIQSFGIATAGIVAVLVAIVTAGFWECVIQEMRLKKVEREWRRATDRY